MLYGCGGLQKAVTYCGFHHPPDVRYDAEQRKWVPIDVMALLPPKVLPFLDLRKNLLSAKQVVVRVGVATPLHLHVLCAHPVCCPYPVFVLCPVPMLQLCEKVRSRERIKRQWLDADAQQFEVEREIHDDPLIQAQREAEAAAEVRTPPACFPLASCASCAFLLLVCGHVSSTCMCVRVCVHACDGLCSLRLYDCALPQRERARCVVRLALKDVPGWQSLSFASRQFGRSSKRISAQSGGVGLSRKRDRGPDRTDGASDGDDFVDNADTGSVGGCEAPVTGVCEVAPPSEPLVDGSVVDGACLEGVRAALVASSLKAPLVASPFSPASPVAAKPSPKPAPRASLRVASASAVGVEVGASTPVKSEVSPVGARSSRSPRKKIALSSEAAAAEAAAAIAGASLRAGSSRSAMNGGASHAEKVEAASSVPNGSGARSGAGARVESSSAADEVSLLRDWANGAVILEGVTHFDGGLAVSTDKALVAMAADRARYPTFPTPAHVLGGVSSASRDHVHSHAGSEQRATLDYDLISCYHEVLFGQGVTVMAGDGAETDMDKLVMEPVGKRAERFLEESALPVGVEELHRRIRLQLYQSVDDFVSDLTTVVAGWMRVCEPGSAIRGNADRILECLAGAQARLRREQRHGNGVNQYVTSPSASGTSKRRGAPLSQSLGTSQCAACGHELMTATLEMHGSEDTAELREWLCTRCLEGQRPEAVIGKRFWSYWKHDKTWFPGKIIAWVPKARKFYLGCVLLPGFVCTCAGCEALCA
jgi:hypothetical protein